jgi:hypothetical protein
LAHAFSAWLPNWFVVPEGPDAVARFLAAERAEMRPLIAVEGIKLD